MIEASTAILKEERLLSISGEDTLSIPRKFLADWTGKLSTRLESEERRKRERGERRLEDEIASLLFSSDRRGGK